MPKQKDLKRRVRARMQKTGESYTAARAQLLRKRSPSPAASPTTKASVDLAAIAGMRDDAVLAKTGKTWSQWVRALDAIDAASLPHREIASRLSTDFEVPAWWAQMVTVGYERIRGLREKGQGRDGVYEVGKSKTFPVPIDELYAAFGRRRRWLADVEPTVKRATDRKSVRMTWPDGTKVEVLFFAKGAAKSMLNIQHRGIKGRAAADQLRAFWTARLATLGEVLAETR
jgi:hypothetical protein